MSWTPGRIRRTAPLAALLLAACESTSALLTSVGEPTLLHVGEAVEFEGSGLRVGFTAVRDDSRCPPPDTGVVCVWEGAATVALWAEKPPQPRSEIRLATSDAGGRSAVALYAGYEIEIVSLTPPHVGEIEQSEYGLTVVVRRAKQAAAHRDGAARSV